MISFKNKSANFLFLLLLFCILACNRDEVIEREVLEKPIIELDSESAVYLVKVGRVFTISPKLKNAENAQFSWIIDGRVVATGASYSAKWDAPTQIFILFRVETKAGRTEKELRVDVADLTPPLISLAIPSEGLKVLAGATYLFTPDIQNKDEGFKCEWIRDGIVVSTDSTYQFAEEKNGIYHLTIKASNLDGETIKELAVEVVPSLLHAEFEQQSYFRTLTDRYCFVGRTVFLRPLIGGVENPHFVWSVNGAVLANDTDKVLSLTPNAPGEYLVNVVVQEKMRTPKLYTRNITRNSESVSVGVKVFCVAKSEEELFRAASATSKKEQNKVYEYTPAPGQYIGEILGYSGFTGNELTPEAAAEYAQKRMSKEGKEFGAEYVSLGAFGGYIIVGFDHSVPKTTNDYDFAIQGNAFEGSSEPGIVWVMQDVNGNGLPDDEWYELKGSETGKPETKQDYSVSYFRPGGPKMNVLWVDSEGKSGFIQYLAAYHKQDYYYPTWVKENSYTLRGTCLKARNRPKGELDWINAPYDWGYADNFGQDKVLPNATTGEKQLNRFKIANAIYKDGSPVDLKYIDFIKVQVGVNAKSGRLGELSTELFSFFDLSMENND